jgi:hypothetical protein
MTSQLNVDTISDKAGTGPVGLTKQSAAKVFVDLTGTSTIALNKSLNVSGTTDNGTGDYTYSYTNSLDGADYSVVCDVAFGGGFAQNTRVTSAASGSARILTTNTGNANAADAQKLYGVNHGDLA